MLVELTKDADKAICTIYKDYLEKIKTGIAKSDAKDFTDFNEWAERLFPKWNVCDLKETICELTNAFDIPMYMNCGFILDDAIIVYMENRFKSGFKEVVEFISHFIP